MNVTQLRAELKKRGLDTTGLKAKLEERLANALESDALMFQQLRSPEGGSSGSGSGSGAGAGAGEAGSSRRKRKHDDAKQSADLVKQLECPVCMELIVPPIYQCENG